jgi:hypothetical protein
MSAEIPAHFYCFKYNHLSCKRKNSLPFEENNAVGWQNYFASRYVDRRKTQTISEKLQA